MTHPRSSHPVTRRTLVVGTAAAVTGAVLHDTRAAENATRPAKQTGTLRVAQIGAQGHFGDVVNGIPKVADCRLVAVARSFPDEKIEDLKRFPAWNAETRIYDDYRKMLDEAKPDLVAVFGPYAHNGPINVEVARRGCHILSEKPIAATMEDLDRLRAERDRTGARVTAMLPMRLIPAFAAAHQAVKQGRIGEPCLISAQKSYRWSSDRPWYFKQRKDYGGSIPWVAIHAIDYIRFVTGLDYASVTARQAVKVHKDYPECEDCGALLFEMTNGGQAALTFDFLRPAKATSHGDDRLRVVGSQGIVELRLTDKTFCELTTAEQEPAQLPLPESHRNVFVDFVQALRGQGQHFLAPDDPFRATEVALKARLAADTRKTVAL